MKLKSILRSNHDLKKNGYKIIRKLHKLEKKDGSNRAYSSAFEDTYFFVLTCRELVEIIRKEYPDAEYFIVRCNTFLSYLDSIAAKKAKIEKSVLASFLRAYTRFFNNIIEEKHRFDFGTEILEKWNSKCLMAYIAAWGDNR